MTHNSIPMSTLGFQIFSNLDYIQLSKQRLTQNFCGKQTNFSVFRLFEKMLQYICLRFLNELIKTFFGTSQFSKWTTSNWDTKNHLLVNERKRKCGFSRSRTREPWDRKRTRYHCTKISLMKIGQKNLWCHDSSKKLSTFI